LLIIFLILCIQIISDKHRLVSGIKYAVPVNFLQNMFTHPDKLQLSIGRQLDTDSVE